MPAEVKARLDAKAKKEDRSLNWLICKILEEAMQRDQSQA
ncbi:TPA: Arc family DNA-binding protein [Pseudomonas aeruginosa]|nr:Arc family DNA-binding protein [Pseudomonas aeruginosa]